MSYEVQGISIITENTIVEKSNFKTVHIEKN